MAAPTEVYTLRNGTRSPIGAVCLFRIPNSAAPSSASAPFPSTEFIATATFLTTTIHSLRTYRPVACLSAPVDPIDQLDGSSPSAKDKKVTAINVTFPLLYVQTNNYSIHIYNLIDILSSPSSPSSTSPNNHKHVPIYSIPINSLNFCKASFYIHSSNHDHNTTNPHVSLPGSLLPPSQTLLMGTVAISQDSDNIDILNISTREFVARNVSPASTRVSKRCDPVPAVPVKTGMVMCLRVFPESLVGDGDEIDSEREEDRESGGGSTRVLVAVGYESGDVCLFRFNADVDVGGDGRDKKKNNKSKSNGGGRVLWCEKLGDQPVICMDLYSTESSTSSWRRHIITGGAEESVTRFTLSSSSPYESPKRTQIQLPIGSKGVTTLQARADGKVIAVACWDSM
ncbi:hypothetical protein HDU79_011974 [Rhizoclosmatium sp. JEL0117]|nr:hypothetical protein HDU79_011974 [Rhizoclosmatium sp. JEL0117]